MPHVCFCALLADHLDNPAVVGALDRLRDEVTIARCVRTSTDAGRVGLGRLRDWRAVRSVRKPPFRRALEALAYGPLSNALLVDEVYGPPVADREEMGLRRRRVEALVRRQVRIGRVVRVGYGVVALPDRTEGMRMRSVADCRAVLSDPRVLPSGGLTVAEIADRFDVRVETVRKWIDRLRRDGAPLVAVRQPHVGRGSGGFKYRIRRDGAA